MATVTVTEYEYDDEGRVVKETVTTTSTDTEPLTFKPYTSPPQPYRPTWSPGWQPPNIWCTNHT